MVFHCNALGLFPNNPRFRAHCILRSHLLEFQYSGLFVTLSVIDYLCVRVAFSLPYDFRLIKCRNVTEHDNWRVGIIRVLFVSPVSFIYLKKYIVYYFILFCKIVKLYYYYMYRYITLFEYKPLIDDPN